MIAQIALIENWKEIDKAKDMNIPEPKEIYEYQSFGFRLEDVSMFHLEEGNRIALIFDNRTFVIKYEEEIYKALVKEFE